MKRKWAFPLLIFLLVFASINGYSQEKQRIAVITLNYIGVSKADAQALTSLLETALVNTDAFNVLEQTETAEILKAQEYTLSGCTDIKCAIKFGKLLAAGEIVLGSVSKLGAKYIVTAKIINVETAKTVKADKVEAGSIEKLSDQMDLLGFKLAGLTFKRGGKEEVAKAFGEIFVQTEPAGAEVYLNGVKKGNSPVLLDKVPNGQVSLKAIKGNMYVKKEIEVKEKGLTEVTLNLRVSLGNLFIKTDKKSLNVYLDGKELGELGSGLFKSITSGDHTVELKGVGYYWNGSVEIKPDKTVMLEAYPEEIGYIEYVIPANTSAEISGTNFRKVLHGKGKLDDIRIGNYKVKITGKHYKPYVGVITVHKGATVFFSPFLKFTDEYKAELAEKKKHKEYSTLTDLIKLTEDIIVGGKRLEDADIEKAKSDVNRVKDSKYSFPLLKARAESALNKIIAEKGKQDIEAKIKELTEEREKFKLKYKNDLENRKKMNTWGWISLGTGIIASAVTGASIYFGNNAYASYKSAQLTKDAVKYRGEATLYNTAAISGGITGVITLTLPFFLWNTEPKPDAIKSSIHKLDVEILKL